MIRRILPLLFLLGACGDDGGGGITVENFGEKDVEEECEFAVRCGLSPDMETCVATQEVFDPAQILSDQEAGLFEADPALLAACLQRPDTCVNEFNLTAEAVAALEACVDAQRGTLADGEACNASSQCQSFFCSRECQEACCEGVCAAASFNFGQVGDPCNGPSCAVGLYCQAETQFGGTCQPQIAASQPCNQPDACIDGHYCVAEGQPPGTCLPMGGPGENCSPLAISKDFSCADYTTYCDSQSGTCDPRPGDGESCGETIPCLAYAFCDSGTCRTRPTAGESCDAQNGPSCLGDLECLSGMCALEDSGSTQVCTL